MMPTSKLINYIQLPEGFKWSRLKLLSDSLPLNSGVDMGEGKGTYLVTDGKEVIEGVRSINIKWQHDEFVTVTIELDILEAELHYYDDTKPFRLIRV